MWRAYFIEKRAIDEVKEVWKSRSLLIRMSIQFYWAVLRYPDIGFGLNLKFRIWEPRFRFAFTYLEVLEI